MLSLAEQYIGTAGLKMENKYSLINKAVQFARLDHFVNILDGTAIIGRSLLDC